MSISQLNAAEGPPDSAVQNRLTAAGLVLTTLFFAGSFALQLHAQSRSARGFVETFGYLEVALAVGALTAIVSITGLLACQQCVASDRQWYKSKRAWFTVATVAQYLSMAFLLASNAVIYLVQDGAALAAGTLLHGMARQLLQPLMWLNAWGSAPPQ